MKQLKKTILTLVALLAVTTGAWADDTYTIKFEANGNSKTVENVTLPHTFSCDYSGENGELDQIIKQLYGLSGGCCGMNSPGASGNSNVTAGVNGDNQFITISAPFEGNATVTGAYFDAAGGYIDFDYSLTISCPGYDPNAGSSTPETETLLTTITATAKEQASYSTANVATVSFSYTASGSSAYLANWGWWGYGWIATVTAAEGYTITKCIFYDDANRTATDSESPFVVETTEEDKTPRINGTPIDGGNYQSKGLKKIEVYGYVTPPASSGPKVAWTAAEKTGTFKMPGGNVTLEPEYYPQATVAEGAVTAADDDARATTDDPLVKVDATKLTGAKKLMYFVSNSGTTAPAYDAEGWTDQLPTAEKFKEAGEVYVWYYPVGTDDVDPAKTYSDGDMNANALSVTIAAAPTYAVTFAEGVNPEPPAEPEWTASPAAGVKKGETVTVTYTGSKKVIGVKAEKKAAGVKVTAITLNKTATTITAGQTETLSVSSVTPDDATDQTVTWSSDNEAVATVDADGKVTAVALGTANITATANDGSGVTATCAVTVNKVVTINQSDWGDGYSGRFTKDGVTVSAGMIDSRRGNLMDDGSFSTTLGNFTKIVVTTTRCYASGTGWSGSRSSMTWEGTPASTVSFSGEFLGNGTTQTTIVCTIEPTN